MIGDELTKIFKECKLPFEPASDKGENHNYGAAYEYLLRDFRCRPFKLLEIGVAYGSGLRAFGRYCPHVKLFGFDLIPGNVQYVSSDVTLEMGDQYSVGDLQNLIKHAPFDFIIDDCTHMPEPTTHTLTTLWPMLAVGGIYVIEDLQVRIHPHYQDGTKPVFDQIIDRLFTELDCGVNCGVNDRITIVAGELVAFLKLK